MLRRPISMQPAIPASVSQILHLPMDSFIHHPSHPKFPRLDSVGDKATRSHSNPAGAFDLIDYHAHAAKLVTKRGFVSRRRKQQFSLHY